MDQKRLVLWVLISATILLLWSIFFPPQSPTPQQQPENASQSQQKPANAQQLEVVTTSEPPSNATFADGSSYPRRTLTVVTPLYEAKFDSRGAVATSWIIRKNKDTDRQINGFGNKPLEMISQEGLQKDQAPLKLISGDASLDAALATQNYKITVDGTDTGDGDLRIDLSSGENKRVDFTLGDSASGLDLTKSLVFHSDQYSTELQVKASRQNQPLPRLLLTLGPSIGDQTVPEYTFYSVAPEAIIRVNDDVQRSLSSTINEDHADRQTFNGKVDWAAVGDTYFAMAAVPSKPADSVEYRTSKYEFGAEGKKEARFLVTGLMPVPATGEVTHLYIGPKDHYLLTRASESIGRAVNRNEIDLEGLIDYGLFSSVSRPIAVPILWSIKHLHKLTNSYGLAIIIFTIIIYSLFFPLKWRSSKAMKKAQKLAPRMKELQEKMKSLKQNDPRLKELQLEQLRLMKEGNPLGGCLPLLIQMPFLFALYRAITISIDFRQASFLWIPDLSAAEPTTIHILPILMAGSMLVLQLITPAPSADPLQRKMMAFMMPAMMLWMLWSAPAGLLVYWLVGNIVSFAQQFVINRLTRSEDDEEQQPPGKSNEVSRSKKLSTPRVSQA